MVWRRSLLCEPFAGRVHRVHRVGREGLLRLKDHGVVSPNIDRCVERKACGWRIELVIEPGGTVRCILLPPASTCSHLLSLQPAQRRALPSKVPSGSTARNQPHRILATSNAEPVTHWSTKSISTWQESKQLENHKVVVEPLRVPTRLA